MKKPQIIFHVDLNAFFASCEIAENNNLLNKPVVVAHDDPLRRSIILTANYKAREYGIKTTMMVKEAIKLAPGLVIIAPDMKKYKKYSNLFFDYLFTITPNVEIGSIDEGYLDVSDLYPQYDMLNLANKIQKDLYNLYMLPCSIGIGPNKFLAKTASDFKKPMGITILRKREIDIYLWPLPIEKMYGVGKKTAPKLKELGINTVGDLANFTDVKKLQNAIGENIALTLIDRANGIDDSIVDVKSNDEVQTMSVSHTFSYNISDELLMKNTLKSLTNTLSFRLEEKSLKANTIGIQIKYGDFKTINRSQGLDRPVVLSRDILNIVLNLFEEFYDYESEVRLLGVFANRITKEEDIIKQYNIFEINELDQKNAIYETINEINKNYNSNIISIGINKKD